MQVAEQLPSFEMPRRRSRRRRSRWGKFVRNLGRGWRRTRLRKAFFSLILVVGAVIGGYKVSMLVASQDVPAIEEFNQDARKK